MAVPFTPPRAPSVGLTEDVTPRVQSVSLGDGYSQDSPDGINTMLAAIQVAWMQLTEADADAIVTFFAGLAGVGRFTYQLPGNAVARQWKCTAWRKTWLKAGTYAVTAQWQEVVL
ncbi:phage tail protein [Shumkonia mesophila]|uniref:phage tail protein n=1 Tax=Shumkonia mesophila TaxID=2838854 RepID=UPI0029348974|nr:phage tail protein [Shumkonia mesophila]